MDAQSYLSMAQSEAAASARMLSSAFWIAVATILLVHFV